MAQAAWGLVGSETLAQHHDAAVSMHSESLPAQGKSESDALKPHCSEGATRMPVQSHLTAIHTHSRSMRALGHGCTYAAVTLHLRSSGRLLV